MADYYPLLSRAVSNRPDSTPEVRQNIYERARNALLSQLRGADPAPSEEAVAAELAALQQAMDRIENEQSQVRASTTAAASTIAPPPPRTAPGVPAAPLIRPPPPRYAPPPPPVARHGDISAQSPVTPTTDTAMQPVQPAASPKPAADGLAPAPQLPVPPVSTAPAVRPPAPHGSPADASPQAPVTAEPTATGPAARAPQAAGAVLRERKVDPAAQAQPSTSTSASETPVPPAAATAATQTGPADQMRPPATGSGVSDNDFGQKTAMIGRGKAIAASLVLFAITAGTIGVFSWNWRILPDRFIGSSLVADARKTATDTRSPAGQSDNKISGRADPSGNEPASNGPPPASEKTDQPTDAPATRAETPAAPSPSQNATIATAPSVPLSPAERPAIAIAQRAAFLAQAPATDNKNEVKTYTGTVVWSKENLSRGSGQPLSVGVRAAVTIPDAKLRATMTIEKNTDSTLPASHTITWRFQREEGSPVAAISEVGMLLMRDEGNQVGTPLSGVPAKITPNDYIIALAAPEALLTANLEAMMKRGWFDLPMKLEGGLQAKITLEKGSPGDKILADAYEKWGYKQDAKN